jgi:DUF4097 and DUF4098 domain-containing protein YvlB
MILLMMIALVQTAGRQDGTTAGALRNDGHHLPSDRPAVRPSATTDTVLAVSPGTRLTLESMNGDIVVKSWDRNQVRVQATHARRDQVLIHRAGAVLSIEAEGTHGPPDEVNFDLTVPAWMAVSLENLNGNIQVDGVRAAVEIANLNGDITVNGGAGSITLESTAGSITLNGGRGRIALDATGGNIVGRDLQGDLVVTAVSGHVALVDVDSKSVQVENVTGDVLYSGTIKDGGSYTLSTHSGEVYLGIPEGANATVATSVFSGEVRGGFPLPQTDRANRSERSYRFGNGSAAIELETFSGSIHLVRPAAIAERLARRRR